MLWLDLWARAPRDPAIARSREALDRRWRTSVVDIVREGQSAGEFATIDAEDFALRFCALVDGLAIQVVLADPDVSVDRMREVCLRTASTEALLRRFTSETTHPAYAAILETGRAQRSIFLARWLRDRDLQRETESGLNVVENYNGVNDYIRFGKRGELASNRREEQELGMLCLHILQSSLGLINTLMIQRVLTEPAWSERLTTEDLRGLTPLLYTHVNPYGTFSLDLAERLALDPNEAAA